MTKNEQMKLLEKIKDLALPVMQGGATDEDKKLEYGYRLDNIAELCEQEIEKLKQSDEAELSSFAPSHA